MNTIPNVTLAIMSVAFLTASNPEDAQAVSPQDALNVIGTIMCITNPELCQEAVKATSRTADGIVSPSELGDPSKIKFFGRTQNSQGQDVYLWDVDVKGDKGLACVGNKNFISPEQEQMAFIDQRRCEKVFGENNDMTQIQIPPPRTATNVNNGGDTLFGTFGKKQASQEGIYPAVAWGANAYNRSAPTACYEVTDPTDEVAEWVAPTYCRDKAMPVINYTFD